MARPPHLGLVRLASVMRILLVSGATILLVGAGMGGAGPAEDPSPEGSPAPMAGPGWPLVEGHTALAVLEIGPRPADAPTP